MTIEEKAKAYDEALEGAKGLLEIVEEDKVEITKDDVKSLFPQLRESKNERIRQFLIERIISLYGADSVTPDGIAVNDIVSYLEKQKEQKPMKWSEEDEIHVRSIFGDFRQDVVPDEEDQDWLKKKLESLRLQPLWKPSEEQMKELKDASAVMKCDSDDNAFPSLKTLYEQLEKL